MKVLRGDFTKWESVGHPTWVTIGVFDGVHRGHQSILRGLEAAAAGGPIGVITFREHPASVTAPEHAPQMLTSLEQRLELLESEGVAVVAVLDFSQVRHMAPSDFVSEIVAGVMNARRVAVGRGFRFGYNMSGDEDGLTALGEQFEFSVEVLDIMGGDSPVSSTEIRKALAAGDIDRVTNMLGRPFQLRGHVVVGDRRGRQLGFPTANLELATERALPQRGVYSAMTRVADDKWHPSVVNVGVRPTFGGMAEVVEVHLLDADIDLYGQELRLDLVRRIRPERRFSGVEQLVAQIGRDIEVARTQLGLHP